MYKALPITFRGCSPPLFTAPSQGVPGAQRAAGGSDPDTTEPQLPPGGLLRGVSVEGGERGAGGAGGRLVVSFGDTRAMGRATSMYALYGKLGL